MRYVLNERYLLRGWEKLPYAVTDRKTGLTHFISAQELDALMLCNGKIETDLPLIPQAVREMLPVLKERGIIRDAEHGETLLPEQAYRKYPARYLRTAHWSITGRCNYRCKHCYMSAPDAKYGELSHAQILKMVQELADCGVMNVSLTGGEPLVRSDFLEIVDALLERGIRITQIYSNGALVKEPLLSALDSRGIHPEFNMSYDGVGWHDWLRGVPGAEAAVDRAFRLCRDMGFPTGSELCLHQGNRHLLRESVNHLRDVGCRSVKTNPISDVGEWHKNGYGESIPMDELFRCYLAYLPHYYEDGMPIALQLGGFFFAEPKKPDRWDVPMYRYPADPSKSCLCSHARVVLYISPEGRALPCMSLSGMDIQEQFPLIPEVGLQTRLTDSFYMDFINTRADKVLEHNPECGGCPWRNWCLGGCRASGLDGSGQTDLLYKDPACCAMYRDGWLARLTTLMQQLKPGATGPVCKDQTLLDRLAQQREQYEFEKENHSMTDNLKKFLEEASKDEALIEKICKAESKDVILSLAAEKGFALTAEDLSEPKAPNGEVCDDELEAVAGGKTCVCVAGGGGEAGGDDHTCWCVLVGEGSGYYHHHCGYYGTKDGNENRCFCMGGGHGETVN